jgi:hypothetical protein
VIKKKKTNEMIFDFEGHHNVNDARNERCMGKGGKGGEGRERGKGLPVSSSFCGWNTNGGFFMNTTSIVQQ